MVFWKLTEEKILHCACAGTAVSTIIVTCYTPFERVVIGGAVRVPALRYNKKNPAIYTKNVNEQQYIKSTFWKKLYHLILSGLKFRYI